MSGMTDLAAMLASLTVSVRNERYTFVTLPPDTAPPLGDGVEAIVREAEGDTVVATVDRAVAAGWPIDFEAAWLTLEIHSALEAVGLTAAFSAALADAEISCNVLAGFHHDHLLVPAERADDAVAAIAALRES
ncbi:MAG: ACT domain-containing protein [Actinomycetota bacterium]